MKTLLNLWAVANVIGVSAALDLARIGVGVARSATNAVEDAVDGFEVVWRPSAHAALRYR